tara:strand:+ start:895 stop:1704 length:810 start_codon:yes stop_codon:yes gene_type:complete
MKVLSIDIGIKNLAFILMEHEESNSDFHIIKWDVINLCNTIPNCTHPKCNAKAKFYKNNSFYCKKHTKNEEFKIPNINIKTLSKQNIKTLNDIIDKNNISIDKKTNKQDLIKKIEEFMENYCFNVVETINANNVNLIDLGINMKCECNKIFDCSTINSIDMIIIENQISPIANRMKTIQGMIAQYFIDRGNYNIEFISAANKLKLFIENKKTSYSERKKLSIVYTGDLLNKKNKNKEIDFFTKHSKKDDLADCFLQGIYYLNTYNKLKV